MGYTIDKSMMNSHNTYSPSVAKPVRFIVCHFTAGVSSKSGQAKNTLSYFNNISTASATFCIDDANIMQYTDYKKGYRDWHAGNYEYNIASVGIEICSNNKTGKVTTPNDSNWYFTDACIDRAVWLVQQLLKEFPDAKVIRHYDCTRKACPGIKGWGTDGGDDSAWQSFLKRVKSTTSTTTSSTTTSKTSDNLYRIRKKWSDSSTQIGAYSSFDNAVKALKKNYGIYSSDGTLLYKWDSEGKWDFQAVLYGGETIKSKTCQINNLTTGAPWKNGRVYSKSLCISTADANLIPLEDVVEASDSKDGNPSDDILMNDSARIVLMPCKVVSVDASANTITVKGSKSGKTYKIKPTFVGKKVG